MRILIFCIALIMSMTTYAQVKVYDNYSSWNEKRPLRTSTKYIVLHTTESNNESGKNAVYRYGTCNYIVLTDGTIYRIIDRRRVAYHAGRSMWRGVTNLSECSIGIEVVGYHNKKPTAQQLRALKWLIADLQRIYKLSDAAVVTHSMVAYGAANKWFSHNHRGRKRCGMWFAKSEIRKAMGVDNVFTSDPDVKAGRLINADPVLAQFIYGATKDKASVPVGKPVKGVTEPETVSGNPEAFEGFRVIDGTGVYSIAGSDYNKATTIYFFADGRIKTGKELAPNDFRTLPKGTKVLVGYVYGGQVSKNRTAYSITGKSWKHPSTFYRLPDQTIRSGDAVNDSVLPAGSIVLFRR